MGMILILQNTGNPGRIEIPAPGQCWVPVWCLVLQDRLKKLINLWN